MSASLTPLDAFFVAYQEASALTMHLGAELHFEGALTASTLRSALEAVLERWPFLASSVAAGWVGLHWGKPAPIVSLLREVTAGEFAGLRNSPIDPFRAPVLSVCYLRDGSAYRICLRVHHCALDGEGFVLVCLFFSQMLAARLSGRRVDEPRLEQLARGSWKATLDPRKVPALLQQQQRHQQIARAQNCLALRTTAPGVIDVFERTIAGDSLRSLRERAASNKSRALWWGMAAWMRALHSFNLAHGTGSNSKLSLEVPMSLRTDPFAPGNHVSPLLFFQDASHTLQDLAAALRAQFHSMLEAQEPLATGLLAAPAAMLPWKAFRRVAVNPNTTGFATSHFVWLSPKENPFERCAERSEGKLVLQQFIAYTPVCLRMGAALTSLEFPDRLVLLLTHRCNGINHEDARALMELFCNELELR